LEGLISGAAWVLRWRVNRDVGQGMKRMA